MAIHATTGSTVIGVCSDPSHFPIPMPTIGYVLDGDPNYLHTNGLPTAGVGSSVFFACGCEGKVITGETEHFVVINGTLSPVAIVGSTVIGESVIGRIEDSSM